MANDTFYKELGVEPYGFVGQDTGKIDYLSPYTCLHILQSTTPTLKANIPIEGINAIHRILATSISIQTIIPTTGLSAIHKVVSSLADFKFQFDVYNSIHDLHFNDKWNAHFNWNYSRYLDTPYKLRLIETPVFDKCHDPSIIPGDPADDGTGSIPGIGGMHNDLGGLQGGVPGEYYHLSLFERNKLATMRQGSITFVEQYQPDPNATGDAWVNSESNILKMYYNTEFNDVSVQHSSEADEVDGGYF